MSPPDWQSLIVGDQEGARPVNGAQYIPSLQEIKLNISVWIGVLKVGNPAMLSRESKCRNREEANAIGILLLPASESVGKRLLSVLRASVVCLYSWQFQHGDTEITERSEFTRRDPIFPTDSFAGWDLTKECALAHERAIALMGENLKQKRLPTNPCQEPLRNLPMPSLTVGLLTRSS